MWTSDGHVYKLNDEKKVVFSDSVHTCAGLE